VTTGQRIHDHTDDNVPRIPVRCQSCKAIFEVPIAWHPDIENYICTTCVARVTKRLEREELFGQGGRRLAHGGITK